MVYEFTYSRKSKERDAKQSAARGNDFTWPGDGHSVAVANGAQGYLVLYKPMGLLLCSDFKGSQESPCTYNSPPQCVGKVTVLLVDVFFGQVN